jgi:hypothetical protein
MNITRQLSAFVCRLGTTLALAGCAPVYEVRDEFIPPLDPSAVQCTYNCEQIEASCHQDCDRAYARCAEQAQAQAREILPAALEVYAARLEAYDHQQRLYDREYRDYREEKRQLDVSLDAAEHRCRKGERGACAEKKRLKKAKSDLWTDYYGPDGPLSEIPEQPARPTQAQEAARIHSERCHNDCGCMDRFKICYIGCGGRVETRRYCLENCE